MQKHLKNNNKSTWGSLIFAHTKLTQISEEKLDCYMGQFLIHKLKLEPRMCTKQSTPFEELVLSMLFHLPES